MKPSMFLAATGALLASASPIQDVEKRAPVKTITEWVYETEISTATVTLAPGQETPAAENQPAKLKQAPGKLRQTQEKPQRFHDVKDHPELAPSHMFPEPPADVVVETPRRQRPASRPTHGPWDYQPPRSPRPTAAPMPKESAPQEPAPKKPAPKESAPKQPAPKESDPSYPTAAGNLDEYAKAMLDKHNEGRREHSVPALKWSDELAQAARSSAQNCIQNHDNGGRGFGQNLAWLWTSDKSGTATKVALGGVQSWYDEKKNFGSLYGVADPTKGNFNAIGHYTQMVWKATGEVGCATHRCTNSKVDWVTVCNYKKPGNVPGQFGDMVPRPSY